MPIVTSDILYRLSTTAGSAGNTTAGTPNGSLGKYVSTTDLTTATNGMFDDVSGTENAANESEYRCIFVLNNHASLTMLSTVLYIGAEVAGGANVALGADPTATSAKGSSSIQAVTVANEDTAPAGVTFSTPTTAAAGIALGDIPAGSVKAFWVRRTTANTSAVDGDGFTVAVACDTAA